MKRYFVVSLVASTFCFVGSCATDEQEAVEAGDIKLSQNEVANVFPGSMIKGKRLGGSFTNYYLNDGVKLTRKADQVIERKWWINDNGQWCETLSMDDKVAICDVAIYNDGYRLTRYSETGTADSSFILMTGNPEELEGSKLELRQANHEKLQTEMK